MNTSQHRQKRPNESEEDEEDFLGFEEEEVYTTPSHNNNNKRSRKSQHVVKSEDPPLPPVSPVEQHLGYDLQTEEEFINLYQNWDMVDKSVFPPPGPLGLPFEYGWKRELVFRAHTGMSKEKGDVYYITPTGRKLRTRSEILANLGKHLTMDNFSLSKVPLYLGPEYEIVRSAKMKNAVKMPNPREISPSLGKRVPKPKAPKGASPTHTTFVGVSGSPSDGMGMSTRIYSTKVVSPKTPVPLGSRTVMSSGGSFVGRPSQGSTVVQQRPSGVYQVQVQKPQTKIISSVSHSPVRILSSTSSATPKTIVGRTVAQNGGNQTLVVRRGAVHKPVSLSAHEPSNFFRTTAIGYDVLLNVFQCLTVKELLRASRVCRLFNYTAHHPFLWRTVRMKNSHVSDWSGFARALRTNGTRHLDMRKMLLGGGSQARVDEQWEEFVKHVSTVEQLQELDLCGRCPALVVEALYTAARQLRVLNAQSIKDSVNGLTLAEIEYMTELEELRLRPDNWMSLRGTMAPLSALANLRHLSLTMFADLTEDESHVTALAHMQNLETLELGDCSRVIYELSEHVLPNMQLLRRLRLEKGAAEPALMLQVAAMPSLEQLELINFDITAEFNETLGQCLNLRKLMVIPTYLTQSATTNHLIMSGLLGLGATLQVFTWVVTQELLRVTELYRSEGEETIELIPIIKPVPGEEMEEEVVLEERQEAMAEVEMVPLSRVQEILQANLPETYISILKEDMQRTWRLNIVDM